MTDITIREMYIEIPNNREECVWWLPDDVVQWMKELKQSTFKVMSVDTYGDSLEYGGKCTIYFKDALSKRDRDDCFGFTVTLQTLESIIKMLTITRDTMKFNEIKEKI